MQLGLQKTDRRVCVCLCVCVRVCICGDLFAYACLYECVYIHIHVCVCAYMNINIYTYIMYHISLCASGAARERRADRSSHHRRRASGKLSPLESR